MECIQIYDEHMDIFQDSKELINAKYLKVKALHHICTTAQMQLHADAGAMSQKDFTLRHEKCYDKVKELISFLGDIVDQPSELDADILQILDSAMIDYIHETNKLQEINRCYLCYRKLTNEVSEESQVRIMEQLSQRMSNIYKHPEEMKDQQIKKDKRSDDSLLVHSASLPSESKSYKNPSTSIDDNDDQATILCTPHKKVKLLSCESDIYSKKKGKRKTKLIRSHLFPDAILNRFAHAVPLPNNAKVIISHMPGLGQQRKFQNSLVSPHKCTVFMLCSTCELTLSRYGETQFVPQFFDKIYDTKFPSQSCEEQVIRYSEHLYSFCVGLIFRTLYWPPGKYTNEDELQQLRYCCRQYLLSLQSEVLPNLDDILEVYILINPFSALENELNCGFLNSTLSGSCLAILANNSLGSGDLSIETIIKPQYFLIHIGVINILVKLSPSKDFQIPSEFRIAPQGGNYHVPVESKRRSLLPHGMWILFQIVAQRMEIEWLEGSHSHLNFSTDEKSIHQPTESAAKAFNIMKGRVAEISRIVVSGIQPSPDPSIPKVISFLPDQFYVRPFQQPTIELPKGHKLLIHETAGDIMSGNTVFLAVGTERHDRYTIDKPYIIWHYYNRGIQITFGFFISMKDNCFEAGEFLADFKQKLQIQSFHEVMQTTANINNTIPGILQAKGFYNFQSLMNRVINLR